MSGSWGNSSFQPNMPGQVKLFDPTQFQTPMSAPASGAPSQPGAYSQPSQSSWNSWGNWDWSSDNTNASAGNNQQQQQPGQGLFSGNVQTSESRDTSLASAFSNSGSVSDQHHFYQGHNAQGAQQSQAWNQSWDGAGSEQHQYQPQASTEQQYPAYDQPGAVGGPNEHLQPQHYQEGNGDQNQYGSHQFYEGQYYNQQQHYLQQQQQYNEEPAMTSYQGDALSEQQQQSNQEQNYQHLQYQQGQHQHAHHQGYYDQPYEASSWNATSAGADQWDSSAVQPSPGEQHQEPVQTEPDHSRSAEDQATPQTTETVSFEGKEICIPQHTTPALDAFDDNDNDGTVSGFFGRDDDGDIPSESPRLGRSGGLDVRNQLPVQQAPFHRTHSDISNASLTTLNFPQSEGDDDDDGDPLHHVQELVQRMEATQLAQASSEAAVAMHGAERLQQHQGMSGDSSIAGVPPGGFPAADAVVHASLAGNGDQAQQQDDHGGPQIQSRGDYSGFGGGPSDFNVSNKLDPPNLPLDTDLRPASPDGDDHPGSGGSGASGGSSGLADWEIVPSQISSGRSHSGHSSLDNGVSGGGSGSFFTDKPDGGIASSSSNQGVAPAATSDISVSASADSFPPSLPSPSDSGILSDPAKHQVEQSTVGQGDERTDRGYSGTVTDNPVPHISQQLPVDMQQTVSTAPPPSKLTLPPTVPLKEGDASENPFRRDGKKSPRHASLAQPVNTVSAMPPPPIPSTVPSQGSVSKEQGLSALPSRPKPPQVSSTEDGIPARRRESERISGQKQAHDSSSSQDQRRHHSAFHPVSRPRRTTMSPATTLWDQEDTSNTNILLAPAVPLIINTLNPYSAEAAATSTVNDPVSGTNNRQTGASSSQSKDISHLEAKADSKKGGGDRKVEDPNRSLDSLDEIDDVSRNQKDRSYREQREREERYRREADRDRPSSRVDRPNSRTGGQYHYDRDRPSSRADAYGREDPYRRRAYYRDYGDLSYDERYDRPRSRPDDSRGSRPTSRTGQQEVERPRSRANYDRDREYYGRGDRHRGYGYDPYGRHVDYGYDERDRYYRYYREKEARYARGYYEEYYGAKQAEQYMQQQEQYRNRQQQHRSSSQAGADRSSNHSRQSRGATPAGSRGNTPGAGDPSPGPDYYGRHGSRPTSRADYNRDYYYKGYDYSGYYYDGYGYDPYAYGYGYSGYDDSYNQSYDQGRLTPPKYSYPHTRACFGPSGQLVKVLPNRPADGQPALVELQDVQTLLQACPEAEELRKFPGPLTRANTHKKDVLLFCQQKAKECAENVSMTDRESAQLIWRLLELLIKQNGSVVGTDLSDLLLEGHEPSTHEYALHGLRINQSQSPVTGAGEEDRSSSRGADSPALRVSQDRTVISQASAATAGSAILEREAWIDRFRHLLLYGRKKDALDCAMKNNLWGHALFLASKMDSRTHANVMTRFANSAMRMNDPLQTLYQLMSNRQPAAVTCVSDERWGDWRPHLAMMLSNQTSRSDLDRKSICTLGDTLASKGCLHASHFCYLMAQVTLGTYYKKTSKIVLIGSSHTLPMDEFATMDAIQCTEVYEYAQLLGNPAFCLPHFQALYYCEVIANMIQQYPAWFKPSFVKLVYQLSNKLKFSDPQRLHTSVDAQDPLWIQQLSQISAAFEDGSLQPMSGSATPANLVGGTTTSSESGDYAAGYYNNSYGVSNSGYGNSADVASNLNVTGMENYSGQQQQLDGSNYYNGQQTGADPVDQAQLGVIPEGQQQQQQQQDPSQLQQQQQWTNYGQWPQHDNQGYQAHHHRDQPLHHYHHHQHQLHESQKQQQEFQQHHHHHHHHHQQRQQQHLPHDFLQQHNMTGGGAGADVDSIEPLSPHGSSEITTEDIEDRSSVGGGSQFDGSSTSSALYGQGFGAPQQQQNEQSQEQQQQQQQQHPHFQQFPQGGLPPRASITTNETIEDEANVDDDEEEEEEDEVDASTSGFDYFGNVGQVHKVVAPPHRYRSQSNSSSTDGRRRRTTSGSSTGSVKAAPNRGGGGGGGGGSAAASSTSQSIGGSGAGNDKKPGQQGSGWFGGLFSKFGRKGNNEMILPDDKDPAIVWDAVKQKWVNSDGTEEESHVAAPPPKDIDLMGKPPGAPPSTNSVSAAGGGPPPLQPNATANRFSLKAKGARNQYVDVNNPKPVSVPSNLFNVMAATTTAGSSASATPQVYMPGSAVSTDGGNANMNTSDNTNNSNQGLLSVPDTSDQPAAAEVGVNDGSSNAPQVPQMPMLFNPASLKAGSQGQSHLASAGPGLKYGQRRAYPK
ncbi:transport protein sec16a [Plakobranchus ocellatus]|uniref:Protein transport protein sec16 n=1 Tax=Plakobranchus ocellatus TaxID=259542 RepID=A0AAV4DNC0_9GAST|nr:transport protein sec16a [Plakobranchus ocellatus]